MTSGVVRQRVPRRAPRIRRRGPACAAAIPGSFEVGTRDPRRARVRRRRPPRRGARRPGRGRRRYQRTRGRVVLPAPSGPTRRSCCSTTTTTSADTRSATSSTVDGRLLLGYGGSEAMQSPRRPLQRRWRRASCARSASTSSGSSRRFDRDLYPSLGLSRGVFFTREAFGDRPARHRRPDADGRRRHPAGPDERAADRGVHRRLPGVGGGEGAARRAVHVRPRPARRASRPRGVAVLRVDELPRLRHAYWGLDDEAADTFQGRSHDFFALGIDAHLGARRDGDAATRGSRASACRRTRRGGRRDGRAVHLPLPRRERVARPAAWCAR